MLDIDTEGSELVDEGPDFDFMVYGPLVAQLLVFFSGKNLVNCSSNPVGDGHLGLVGGAKFELPSVIFVSVEGPALHLGSVSCLNQNRSQMWIPFSAL